MKYVLFTIAILAISLFSCYNDSEEGLFPMNVIESGNCDTSIYTYGKAIQPLMKGTCFNCHSSQLPVLRNQGDVAADADKILVCIKRTGIHPMPPSEAAKISDCDIVKFEKWIKAGKQNN
jgi:hypothetical protein